MNALCLPQPFLGFSFSLFIAEGISQVSSFHPHTGSLNTFHYAYWSISREEGGKSEMSECESKAWPKEQVITVTLYQSSL